VAGKWPRNQMSDSSRCNDQVALGDESTTSGAATGASAAGGCSGSSTHFVRNLYVRLADDCYDPSFWRVLTYIAARPDSQLHSSPNISLKHLAAHVFGMFRCLRRAAVKKVSSPVGTIFPPTAVFLFRSVTFE